METVLKNGGSIFRMNLKGVGRYLQWTPFDTKTEQGRSNERYRRAALSVFANGVNRGMGMLVMVMSVAITVPYLGAERFGVWMTIASFAGLLTFLDLGVGNALTNRVARQAAQEDAFLLCQTISGGLAFLAVIGMAMAVVLSLLAVWLPWNVLIKVHHPDLLVETRQTALCFAVLFGINIFTSGIQRVFAGLQRSFEGHYAATLGAIAAAAGLWIAATQRAGIPVLLIVMLGSQISANLLLLAVLSRRNQFRFSRIVPAAWNEVPFLFRTGGVFFVLQIGFMVGWGIDSLIISSVLGAVQVAVYSVAQRLFQFVSQPLAIMNAPLWGAYADAHARKDHRFIGRTLRNSMMITLCFAMIGSLAILTMNEWLVAKWTSGKVMVPFALIGLFAIWSVMESCGHAFAMFLNGAGVIKPQMSVVLFFVVLSLPLKWIGVHHLGILAIPLATLAAYLITHVGLYATVFRQHIRAVIRGNL